MSTGVARRVDQVIFAAAIAASLVILFVPSVPGPPLFANADKVVHLMLFAGLAWTGVRAGVPLPAMVGALVLYAGGSEVVQATLLPERSGSWTDLAGDLTGSALGLLAAVRGPAAAGRV